MCKTFYLRTYYLQYIALFLSLHRSIWIIRCRKQCCRSSTETAIIIFVAFSFTASTDWKRVTFNALLTLVNKKSHMELQESRVDAPTQEYNTLPKTFWSTLHCALVKNCLVKNSGTIFPYVESFSSHAFTKGDQNLFVIHLVNRLIFRHPVDMNDPSNVEIQNYHGFEFRLTHPWFLSLGELGLYQCMNYRLIPASYMKTHDSSYVIILSIKISF